MASTLLRRSRDVRQEITHAISQATTLLGSTPDAISLPVPKLVFAGAQSSGKTTNASGILGRPMGKMDDVIATRRPHIHTIYRLPEGETPYMTIGMDGRKIFDDFEALDRLRALNDIDRVSSKPIFTSIYTPDGEPCVVVDLPGRQLQSADPDYPEMKDDIDAMIHEYASDPANVLVSFQVASVDAAASLGVNTALAYDPKGERTMQLLTKLNTAGTYKPNSAVAKVLHDQSKRYGTYGVAYHLKEPISQESIRSAIDDEKKVLSSLSYYDQGIDSFLGIERVKEALSQIYIERVLGTYPTFRPALEECRRSLVSYLEMLRRIQAGGKHEELVGHVEKVINLFHHSSDERNDLQKNLIGIFQDIISLHLSPHLKHPSSLKESSGMKASFNLCWPTQLEEKEWMDYTKEKSDLYPDKYFSGMTVYGAGPSMDNYHPKLTERVDAANRYLTAKAMGSAHWLLPELDARKKRNVFCKEIAQIFRGLSESKVFDELNQAFLDKTLNAFQTHAKGSHHFFSYAIGQVNQRLYQEVLKPQMEGRIFAEVHPLTDPLILTRHLEGLETPSKSFFTDYTCKAKEVDFFSDHHMDAHLKYLSGRIGEDLIRMLFGHYFDQINHHILRFAFENLGTSRNVELEVETKEKEIAAIDSVIATLDEASGYQS